MPGTSLPFVAWGTALRKCKAWLAGLRAPHRDEQPAGPGPAPRRIGVRGRVFTYFLLFTAALLALLWVFQIALLPSFYRLQKTQVLNAALDALASNIDNESLQLLTDRVAQANDVCVLIANEHAERLISSETLRDCVIHRMSPQDLGRLIQLTQGDAGTQYRIFDVDGPARQDMDEKGFVGRVPAAQAERTQSMVAVRRVETAGGEARYLFVNTQITPVGATVQTLQSQYLFIAVFMVALSFLLSLVLSRRIAQPIVVANEAARGLAQGRYEPRRAAVSYREIDQLNRTLAQAAVDLRRVEVMQRELIANISHDLRTPLTLIEGYAEAVRDLPGESTPENMQVIIEEARRLSSLVNAILEYSASQNGHAQPHPAPFDITEGIRRILARYQKLTRLEGYTVRFAPEGSVWVNADEMQIGQVVYNLVNNALTYTGADKLVTVTLRRTGETLRVAVSDTGEGIDAAELPYIWSRYYRGHKPHKRAAVGTGLGLSIVKGILEAHGLPYGVDSQSGAGTTFWFELPVVRALPGAVALGAQDATDEPPGE